MPIDITQVKQKNTKTLGGWWAYDERTNKDIEAGFKVYRTYKLMRLEQSAEVEAAAAATSPPLEGVMQPPLECNLHMENFWNEEDDDDLFDYLISSDSDSFDSDEVSEDWSSDSSSDFEMQYGPESDASDPRKLQQLICGRIYIIDLEQLTQTLRSKPARMRKIMRYNASEAPPVTVKGVAGIYFS